MTTPPGPGPRGTPSQAATSPRPWSGALELMVRAAGAAVAVWGGILLACYATFMTAYRVGTTLVPVSLVFVVAGNAALIWFAYYTTRNKLLALLPGLAWIVVSFLGADRTTEGDLVLYSKNWVGTVYLIAGAGTIAVAAYRFVVPKPPLAPRRPD